tara:strand:+ start:2507 stop:3757 length:1251 start_codon:yes stop_codon:yes gene_type:complete
MEAIFGFIAIVIGFAIFRWLLSAGTRTVGAAGKAVLGKGSFSENMDLAFKGMGEFEIRLVDENLGDESDGASFKSIEGKGLIPVPRAVNLGVIISAFDSTDDHFAPLISMLENFQEPDSAVYQHSSEIGQIEPDQGYISWVRLGAVIPDIIQTPYAGKREISVVVRLVDMDNPPDVRHGYNDDAKDPRVFCAKLALFSHSFEEKGYEEAVEHRDEAASLSVKIGMAVAMADGSLDDAEGEVLKHWIQKAIAPFSDEKRDSLKSLYNQAMRESYEQAKLGDLLLSNLTSRMNEIGEKSSKYETIELCFEVMAADGVADAEELNTIHKVADALELDFAEVAKMRDQKIVGLDASMSAASGVESLLGLDPSWSKEQIKKHLRSEFQKWNNRLNTLPDGDERKNAQAMLEAIAEARKNYA